MTDKERLERIIQMQYDGYTIWDMGENDLVWLIEQAGRVQELEKQNKRYKQALEFYADKETYETKFATVTDEIFDPFTLIKLDEGKKYTNAQIAKVVKYIVENVEMLNNALDDALRVTEIEQQNKRYREAINSIIEKVMLLGTNEEVYEAIQDAIKILEEKE